MLAPYFLPTGRADRLAFWRATAVIGILFQVGSLAVVVVGLGLFSLSLGPFYVGMLLPLAVAVWASLAIGIRRLHDRNLSGWWIVLALVPVVGTLWHLVANGGFAGTPGANRFGAAPRGTGQAISEVFGDDAIKPAPVARTGAVIGTIVLWVVLLAVTGLTLLLFQQPVPRAAASRPSTAAP